jgi:hypothetical protein
MNDSELMMKKREIVSTTNSRGWYYVKEVAEKTIQKMERDAIDEEDDAKGSLLRRQAKAARQFLTTFLDHIESMRRIDAPETPDEETGKSSDDFYEPAFD